MKVQIIAEPKFEKTNKKLYMIAEYSKKSSVKKERSKNNFLHCFAAYYARSIDELSGRTTGGSTGRLGYDGPDSAYAIGRTAELALCYSI